MKATIAAKTVGRRDALEIEDVLAFLPLPPPRVGCEGGALALGFMGFFFGAIVSHHSCNLQGRQA